MYFRFIIKNNIITRSSVPVEISTTYGRRYAKKTLWKKKTFVQTYYTQNVIRKYCGIPIKNNGFYFKKHNHRIKYYKRLDGSKK